MNNLSEMLTGVSPSSDTAVMPNGTKRARRVPRIKSSKVTKKPRNIAAVDFGTKNCSLAYITEHDTSNLLQTGVPKLPLNGTLLRVPTAILLDPDGSILAFGHDARTLYGNLTDRDCEAFFYFEEIKMNLHLEKDISRDMSVYASNGKACYLVDVIAQILKYLKSVFLEDHLKPSGHSFQATQFDWVLTVPAIWRAKGKQIMREAGYMVGLCSEETCGQLTVISSHPLAVPTESCPDKLSLALEPESAALYCHEMLKRKLVAPYCESPSLKTPPSAYLVVDIGGGTVDVSSHKVCKTGSNKGPIVQELHHPVGNDCGGSKVNWEFLRFLISLTNDPDLSKFLKGCDPEVNARNSFDLDEVVNVIFEEQKQTFGRLDELSHGDIVIRLPPSFLEMYRDSICHSLQRDTSQQVTLERRSLRISSSKMREFFQPAIGGILVLLSDLLAMLGENKIEVMYLVGGFGGCPYIYTRIKEVFGAHCQIIVPPNPELAVVEGAVLFYSNPSFIQARRANATIGKSVLRHFDQTIHDPSKKKVDCTGQSLCCDLFQTIVEVGEVLSHDFVYVCKSIPYSINSRNMFIEMFSSKEKAEDVWYTRGERNGEANKIGELVIDMPCVGGTKEREVEVTFDFSHTEIKVTGYDRSSQTQVKTVIDFLSPQDSN